MDTNETFWNKKHSEDYPGIFVPTELAINFIPYLKTNNAKTILEIGCGRSGDAIYFKKNGLSVVALDISFVAIEQQIEILHRQNKLNDNPLFIQCDISKGLPFRDNTFDAVYARLSLHYFRTEQTIYVMKQILRIMKYSAYFLGCVKSRSGESLASSESFSSQPISNRSNFFTIEHMLSFLSDYNIQYVKNSFISSGKEILRPTIEFLATK